MTKSPIKRVLRSLRPPAVGVRTAGLPPVLLSTLATLVLIGSAVSSEKFVVAQGQTSVPPTGEVRTLTTGEVVTRHMNAGETHAFKLKLTANQFAQIVVEQKGVDVDVKVTAPDGSLYTQIDSPNGFYGRETISVVAHVAGSYLIQANYEKGYPPGGYELKVDGPRAASASDEMRVTAERVFTDAQQLRSAAGKVSSEAAGEKYDAAIGKYNEALNLWRELGDLRGQGYSLTDIGRIYKARGKLEPALDHLSQALLRLREAGDSSGQAFVLNETGAAHRDLGDLRDALDCYHSAVKLRIDLGDRWGQAQLYNNLGLVYSYMGYQPKAAENYEKASRIWRELGLRNSEMNTLINAAKANAEMGDLDVALAQYQEVLTFCNTEVARDHSPLKDVAIRLKPFALNGIGLVYDTWADSDSARGNYRQALDLFRANKDSRGEADVLDNLGMAHAFMGDALQALEYFLEALVIRERLNEPKGWGATLSNIGYAHTLLGNNEEALRQLALALPLNERSRDRRFQAYTLVRMGMAYFALNDPRKALESYERALAIQQEVAFTDRRGQAITLDKMGEALALSGQPTRALEKYGRALEHWKSVGDGQGQALSLYGIARVERDRHNLANARDRIEEAIKMVELLRYRVTRQQLQMTYFAGKQDLYALAIDVRMRLYELTKSAAEIEAALSISERARSRNLIDLLSETRTELFKGDTNLERQISVMTQTLLRMRSLGQKDSAAIVEEKLAAHIKEQDELLARSRASAVRASQSRTLTPREIQKLLDDDTLLLQYSLGEVRSHLWAVTATGIDHYFLASRAELEKAAEHLRRALTAYEPKRASESDVQYVARWRQAPDQYRRSALELSRLVLGPVRSQLGHKRLLIVADGALLYIPFEALPSPESVVSGRPSSQLADDTSLLLSHEVIYQPSASALAVLRRARRPSASKTVAVLADPVFDNKDARMRPANSGHGVDSLVDTSQKRLARSLRDIGDTGDGDLTLAKLEYSLKEANAITAVAPRGSWMKAVGFKASRATATSPVLKQFSIVHFATHGILNDTHPELSGVVLSMVNQRGQPDDGYLTLRDIYKLDLPVNLVVLSACQTGVGKQVRGEGVIGLTRGFMYAGAQRVVVSLWRVDDEATAELMKRFYRHMLGKNKLAPSAALRRAKMEMMEAHQQWRAPYYWAGFVLQGDWK